MATRGAVKRKSSIKIQEPRRYKVIMYNDDFTPMDFVVSVLVDIFHKSEQEATILMLEVHNGDSAVVGVYSYDIATTKVAQTELRAKREGHPFRVEAKEA